MDHSSEYSWGEVIKVTKTESQVGMSASVQTSSFFNSEHNNEKKKKLSQNFFRHIKWKVLNPESEFTAQKKALLSIPSPTKGVHTQPTHPRFQPHDLPRPTSLRMVTACVMWTYLRGWMKLGWWSLPPGSVDWRWPVSSRPASACNACSKAGFVKCTAMITWWS